MSERAALFIVRFRWLIVALWAVIGTAGLIRAPRTADLLSATYEYFPAASHFGLVMGERTWPEVAASVLGWLEERRHAMVTASAPVGARR